MAFQNLYPTGMRPKKATFGEKVQDALLNLAGTTAGAYLNRKLVQEPILEQKHKQDLERLGETYEFNLDLQTRRLDEQAAQRREEIELQHDVAATKTRYKAREDAVKNYEKSHLHTTKWNHFNNDSDIN